MPFDKYKTFYEIVILLTHMDLTKLRSIFNELKQLSKIKKVVKKRTKKQKEATKKLIALNKKRRR